MQMANGNTTETYKLVLAFVLPPELAWLRIVEITYLALILMFGTTGNILVILVELKNKIKYSTDYLVICMASIEVFCSTLNITRNILEQTPAIWKRVCCNEVCQLSWYVGYTIGTASPLLLSAIAVDRYVLTCKPLIKSYNARSGKILAVSITIVCPLICIPGIFGVYADEMLQCLPTNDIIDLDKFNVFIIVFTLVSFIIITIAYVCVGRTIRRRNKTPITTVNSTDDSRDSRTRLKLFSVRNILKRTYRVNPFQNSSRTGDSVELQHTPEKQNTLCTTSLHPSSVQSVTLSKKDGKTEHVPQSCCSQERLNKSKQMRKTTLIMFLIALTYGVTHVSGWVLIVLPTDQATMDLLIHLTALFSLINCVSNPAFFFLLSAKFREIAKKILFRN